MVVFYVIGNYSVMFLLHKNVHKTGCIRHMASAIIRDIRIAEVQIRTVVRIDQLNERENTI